MEDAEKYIDEIYCIYKDSKDHAEECMKENRRLLEKMDDIVRWHVTDIKKYTKAFLVAVAVIGLLYCVSIVGMLIWFKKTLDNRLYLSYVVLERMATIQREQTKILLELQKLREKEKENVIEQKE